MIAWQVRLVGLAEFLGLALLSILLVRLLNLGDGYTIFGVTLSAIATLYLQLQMRLKSISRALEYSGGVDIGIMGDSSSVSSIDYLSSKFTAILVENGQSWLLASDLLQSIEFRLQKLELLMKPSDSELLQRELTDDIVNGMEDTEAEDSD